MTAAADLFNRAPRRLFEDDRLTPELRDLYVLIAGYGNGSGRRTPSLPTLAKAQRCSVRTVIRRVHALVELGYVQTEPGRGRGHTTRYWLAGVDGPLNPEIVTPVSLIGGKGDTADTISAPLKGVTDDTLSAVKGDTGVTVPAVNSDTGVQQKVTPVSHDPDTHDPELRASFDTWWSCYPRREAKKRAERAYARALKSATAGELLDGLRRQLPALEAKIDRGEGRFVPLPASWLNAGRWTDEDPTETRRGHDPARVAALRAAGQPEDL